MVAWSSFELLWSESHDRGDSDSDSWVHTGLKSIRLYKKEYGCSIPDLAWLGLGGTLEALRML